MYKDVTMIFSRDDDDDDRVYPYISPWVATNAGLWSLWAGATIFLGLRLWCKITRRHGLWYDDYVLILAWAILLANDSLIINEFATGYILPDSSYSWDDRMHILINISSCGTVLGQALSKTAFGVTLLRLSKPWQQYFLCFCISTMNVWAIVRCVFQWAKVCGKSGYQQWYRLDFCIDNTFRTDFKEGGNVYNVILDFIFASFPWLITWALDMRRIEKIGLCITMSLGMAVAIVSAIRISWKDEGNTHDYWYIYRNGVSQVWYSSEVAGTIMVQCLPILRTLMREIHTTMTAKKLDSSSASGSTNPKNVSYVTATTATTATVKSSHTFGSKANTLWNKRNSKRNSAMQSLDLERGEGTSRPPEVYALREIPEEHSRSHDMPRFPFQSDKDSDSWPLPASQGSDETRGSMSPRSVETVHDGMHSYLSFDSDEDIAQQGLSPPPYRPKPAVTRNHYR